MIRVASVEALRAAGAGSCVAGRTWLHARLDGELWGVVLWGRPDRDDARALVRSLRLELEPSVPPHRSYVDAARLEAADPDAFAVLTDHLRAHYPLARRQFTRVALVVPPGFDGAVVAGFYGTLEAPGPFKVFAADASALRWLDGPADAARAIAEIVTAARGTPPIVDALRAQLCARLDAPDFAAAARALGLSERTLQRRLREAGTSFQKQVHALRIEAARRRLVESDAPLTVIALELGYATPQHFSNQFHKATGESPTTFRRRHAAD